MQQQTDSQPKVHRFRCPGCGADLQFAPEGGNLTCPYCGREERIASEQAQAEGKPEHIAQRIVEGRVKKWLDEVVLLRQRHVNEDKHGGKTIEELRAEISAKTGENIVIRRVARFAVGE